MGVFDEVGSFIPSFSAGSILTVVMWVIGGMLFGTAIAVVVWWFLQKRKFNKLLICFREYGGKIAFVGFIKGTFERIGMAGDYWLKTKKGKICTRPRYEVGLNTYLMFERKDGELINFTFDNLNELMKRAGVKFLDEDVRLARIAIERNLRDRFETDGFFKKYGLYIAFGILIAMMFMFGIIIIRELNNTAAAFQAAAAAFSGVGNQIAANTAQTATSGVVPI